MVAGLVWLVVSLAVTSVGFGKPGLRPVAVLPSHRQILTIAYGKCDVSGNSSTRAVLPNRVESIDMHPDSLTYSVVFVSRVRLASEELVLAVCDAPAIFLEGHRFGYRDFFLFRQVGKGFGLAKSQHEMEITQLGDRNRFDLVEIGRGNLALAVDMTSTGDKHIEVNRTLFSISYEGIRNLFTVEIAYSDEADLAGDRFPDGRSVPSDTITCSHRGFESRCSILPDDKDWYDVRVHRTNFGYTPGCKVRIPESEEEYLLTHDGTGYHEVEKPLAD